MFRCSLRIFEIDDDIAISEIAVHAKVPGYSTYPNAQARIDSDAILDQIYAKTIAAK